MAREIARKITMKQVGWSQEAITAALHNLQEDPEKPKNGVRMDLMKVVGIVRMARPGYSETTATDHLKLIGEFRATNMESGEVLDGAMCLLPNFVADHVSGQLVTGGQVEFAIKLGAVTDDMAIVGYTFYAIPLIETKASDRLEALAKLAETADERAEPIKVNRTRASAVKASRRTATT